MTRLLSLWDQFCTGFWFFPGLMTLAAVILGFGMPRLDSYANAYVTKHLPWMETTPAAAGRTLSAFGGAIAGATGVVFSTTIVVLSLASSQFGPRLLRTFLSDVTTQVTLGTFVGTSLYTLLVMRAIREIEGNPIAPDLSVALATGMSIATFLLLIYFIHHIAISIQAQTVIRHVASDLNDAIERLYPRVMGEPAGGTGAEQAALFEGERRPVNSSHDGYLQAVDTDRLMRLAVDHGLLIEVLRFPGDFVCEDDALAYVRPAGAVEDELAGRLAGCFVQGERPTPRQDVECAIYELVEVAVRALSPGINDPFSAMSCLDYLGAALGRLAACDRPSAYRLDDEGVVRVIARPPSFDSALNAAFDQIRQYGRGSADVTVRALESLCHVARRATTAEQRASIRRQAEMLDRSGDAIPELNDREAVSGRYALLLDVLDQAERAA